MRGRSLALALLVAFGAAGCAARDRVIETWPIGEPLDCRDGDAKCAELVDVGLIGLHSRDVLDAEPTRVQLYSEGAFTDANGNTVLLKRSGGCCQVLVVGFADGTERAIGVGYPGVSTTAIAVPWEMVTP